VKHTQAGAKAVGDTQLNSEKRRRSELDCGALSKMDGKELEALRHDQAVYE